MMKTSEPDFLQNVLNSAWSEGKGAYSSAIYKSEGRHLLLYAEAGARAFPSHLITGSSEGPLQSAMKAFEGTELHSPFIYPLLADNIVWGVIVFLAEAPESPPELDKMLEITVHTVERLLMHHVMDYFLTLHFDLHNHAHCYSGFEQLFPSISEHLRSHIQYDALILLHHHPLLPYETDVYIENRGESTFLTARSDSSEPITHANLEKVYLEEAELYSSTLHIPIIFQGHVIAQLHLYSKLVDHYEDREKHRMEQFISIAAYAISQADTRQRQSIQDHYRRISEKMSQMVLNSGNLYSGTQRLARSMKKWLRVSDLLIWFLDSEQLILRSAHDETLHISLTDSEVVSGILFNKRTIYFNDIRDLSWISNKLSDMTARSVLISPIIDTHENQVIGIMMMIDHDTPNRFNSALAEICDELISSKGGPIGNLILQQNLKRSNLKVIRALTIALDKKDAETQGHSERVVAYSIAIARQMKLSETEIDNIRWGALLHDIGKIGIPDAILLKPGKLNEAEWEIMRTHPSIGFEMMKDIDFLEGAIDIVLYHHERIDGRGYPLGLKGKDIPLGARIFAIADAFDAITSDRPYRKAQSLETARDIIREAAGTQFCKVCVDSFLSLTDQLLIDIRKDYQHIFTQLIS
jgi:putative nucleotidyltransferase with HDIG domain